MLFLANRIDEFGVLDSFYLVVDEDGKDYTLSLEEISSSRQVIVTYHLNRLLSEIRIRNIKDVPILIDISQLKKLTIGRPKKMFQDPPWHFYRIAEHILGNIQWAKYYKLLRTNASENDIIVVLRVLATMIKDLYLSLAEELKEIGLSKRFTELECGIQQLLNRRQIEGVEIDIPVYESILLDLGKHRDKLIYQLRKQYKIRDTSFRSLREFLIESGHKISKNDIKFFNLYSYLKSQSITSDLCKDIYNTIRIKNDYDSLSQLLPDEYNLIYPEFDCIGTITSRILISHPKIQNLKRENRVIFKPKNGFTFLYCDYKQFEPGVLASLSADLKMLEIYNKGDIYEEFSNYIFGSENYRDEAKVLFLSYLYGMSDKKLIKTIDSIINAKGLQIGVSAKSFFSEFKELNIYKEVYSKQIRLDGFIFHDYTLRRNLKIFNGKTVKGEERFLLSQIVQGTAAYIFKMALLACSEDLEIEFLIPMHDAALFQVPVNKEADKKIFIEKCFIDCYKKVCPDINARVDFKPFYS